MASVRQIRLGYNNVYLADSGGARVLIDTGPDYRGASAYLDEELGAHRPELVVATHGHLDHAGLAAHWQRRGVAVAMGAGDVHLASTPQLARDDEFASFAAYVRESGAPPDVQADVMQGLALRRAWAQQAAAAGSYPAMGRDHRWPSGLCYEHFHPARTLADGETAGDALRAILCPGHTPGNLVVADEREGWLFSGDQLLPAITPTPGVQPRGPDSTGADWRLRSLPEFEASLRRLKRKRFVRCFPGHGEPFDGVEAVIDANLSQIEQRTERVAALLRELGAATLWTLADALYPRALRRRFWQIAATVQGHLDILEAQSRVGCVGGEYRTSGP